MEWSRMARGECVVERNALSSRQGEESEKQHCDLSPPELVSFQFIWNLVI